MKMCYHGQSTMRKYRVLQLGLQLQRTFAIHGIYTTLNANKQVATITASTLCFIQFLYVVQLTCNYMQLLCN
jgi:hypothetical protein